VDYVGRLDAHLPMADRLLLLKADGSVSVHADDSAYKPLNWMTPPCTLKNQRLKEAMVSARGSICGWWKIKRVTSCASPLKRSTKISKLSSVKTPAWSKMAWKPICRSS